MLTGLPLRRFFEGLGKIFFGAEGSFRSVGIFLEFSSFNETIIRE